ncbi:MAG TPA: antibiotic biosynthesis monooxygenase [Desulfomonilaceae bacterium]|nr:antibiotic biosynthesis monooxygenase [Desulfomonilaceae bacterium]
MIARYWRGIARPDRADTYIRHLRTDTFPRLSTIDGFVRASILKRTSEQGTEFVILTIWQSMEAIERFAGSETEIAVVPSVVQDMMVAYDPVVTHYEVVEQYSPARAD